MIKFNLSPSSINVYNKSQLEFYYTQIAKAKPDTEVVQCYGKFGQAVHYILEHHEYYKTTEDYDNVWQRFNLDMLRDMYGRLLSKDKFYDSINNGMKIVKKYKMLSMEEEFVFPLYQHNTTQIGLKGFIDFVAEDEDGNLIIGDYKTSSKVDDGESFRRQCLHYAYSYHRKYKRLPTKCVLFYVKINKQKEYEFTLDDLKKYKKYVDDLAMEIVAKGEDITKYDPGDYDHIFNMHLKKCDRIANQKDDTLKFVLKVKGTNITILNKLSALLNKALKKNFRYEVQGAEHVRKKTNWDGIVRLYNEKSQSLGIGFMSRLKNIFEKYCKYYDKKCEIEIRDDSVDIKLDDFNGALIGKTLRLEQDEATDAFIHTKNGIISACTGSGKTLIAAEIIRSLKVRCLFIVDRVDLLTQTKQVFEESLGMSVGQIGSGIVELDEWITVSTCQTLARNIDKYKQFLGLQQLVIVDECQIAAGKGVINILKKCTGARYILGTSATPWRNDAKDMELERFLGAVIYELKTKDAQEKDYLVDANITFYHVPVIETIRNRLEDYNINIVDNEFRNNIIKDESLRTEGSTLILTKTIAHGKMLNNLIPDSVHIHGSVKKDVRDKIWDRMRAGERVIVIATNSIAQKGLDIPPLAKIINAGADGNAQAVIQALGRVLRLYDNKTKGEYIDFMDGGVYTKKWSRIRCAGLKEQGHEINMK